MPELDSKELNLLLFDFLKSMKVMEKKDKKIINLDWSEQFVLKTLDASSPIRMSEIGEALGWAPFAVTRLADRLESRNLVSRIRPDGDKRQVHLELTPEGEEQVERVRELHYRYFTTNLDKLSSEDQQTLLKALKLFPRILDVDSN